MQKASPPLLLPLLRSRLEAEVLTLVLLNPGEEWSLTSLASRTGASVSSVQREITRAEQAGVVSSRRLGNLRLVKAADSPLTAPLTELLLRSFGPRQVLAEELEGVEGIEQAYLFGSWAARYTGEAGRPPADLDVLARSPGAPADQPRRPYRGTRRCHRPVRIQHPRASLVQQAPPRTQHLRVPQH
jgi:DNA-binding transcriptional ArsR family regulator